MFIIKKSIDKFFSPCSNRIQQPAESCQTPNEPKKLSFLVIT